MRAATTVSGHGVERAWAITSATQTNRQMTPSSDCKNISKRLRARTEPEFSTG